MPHSTVPHTTTLNDTKIDVAPLEVIDLARLTANEPSEVEKLLHAATSPGFFWVDLRDSFAKSVPAEWEKIYEAADHYFTQSHEVKMKDYKEGQDRGYKPGEDDQTYEIARDEVINKTLVLPESFREHAELFDRFSSPSYEVSRVLLSRLSDALKLDDAARFENHHRDGEPSDTGLKLYYEPAKGLLADVNENKHTDSGTLTLFFYNQWNIQLEIPETKQWAFIAPKPGHVLVNVADSLQRFSGNKLYSCTHRVTQPHDGFQKRYFAAYFLRPENASKA